MSTAVPNCHEEDFLHTSAQIKTFFCSTYLAVKQMVTTFQKANVMAKITEIPKFVKLGKEKFLFLNFCCNLKSS